MNDLRLFIGDTETTGLGPTRKAVEIALIEIDWHLNVMADAEALLNPGCDITPEAAAIHGITQERIADCPSVEQWVEESFGGKIDGPACLIGYRVAFDKPMLDDVIHPIVKMFDVLPLMQSMLPDLPDHKLQTVREHLGLPGGPAHRAMGDVLTTLQALQVMIPKSGRAFRHHVMADFTMIHRFPWGKHKGKLLLEVPGDYRRWVLGLDDLDPNLRRSLELIASTDVILNVSKRTFR